MGRGLSAESVNRYLSYGAIALGVNAGPSQDLEVAGNTIYNIGNQDPSSDEYAMGIFTWGNDSTDMNDGANIYDNVIHDITTNSSPYAVGIAVGGDSSNATVNGNDITSAVNRGITTSAYMDGAATIENNAVTGATDIGIMARTAHGSTVYRNNVSNSPIGLQVSDGGDLTSARENFFTTNGRGVLVTSNAGAVGPISANSFNGNTAAVDNESGQTVDASANWWGTNVAAAIYGSLLGGNVDFTPYLHSGLDTDPVTPGFQGDFSTLDVTTLGGQTGLVGRIQEAVNLVTSGGTVNVGPGVYNETVTIATPVTVNGAQAGVDARTRSVSQSQESIVSNGDGDFQIEADNVTINGFALQGVVNNPSTPPYTGLGAAVWTNPGFSGTHGGETIINNIIQNNIAGVELDNDGTYPATVQHNAFRDNNQPGPNSGLDIEVDFGLSNALIDSNTFTNSSWAFGGEAPTNNVVFSNNTVTNASGVFTVVPGPSGISILDNTIQNDPTDTYGVYAGGSMTIDGNTITGFGTGVELGDPGSTVTHNLISGNGVGVGVASGVDATGIVLHQNNILGNAVAVNNLGAGTLDATNNWWGSLAGPNVVQGSVIDEPVLFAPAANTPNNGPSPTIVSMQKGKYDYVDANGNQVTIKLNGPGTATLTLLPDGNGYDLLSVVLTGTTNKTDLNVDLHPAKGSHDGTTLIGAISAAGDLHDVNLDKVTVGDITLTGSFHDVKIGDIQGQVQLLGNGHDVNTGDILSGGSLTIAGNVHDVHLGDIASGASFTLNGSAHNIKVGDIAGSFVVTQSGFFQDADVGLITGTVDLYSIGHQFKTKSQATGSFDNGGNLALVGGGFIHVDTAADESKVKTK